MNLASAKARHNEDAQQLEACEASLRQAQARATALEQEIQRKDRAITSRDQEILALEESIRLSQARVTALEQKIKRKDRTITRRDQEIQVLGASLRLSQARATAFDKDITCEYVHVEHKEQKIPVLLKMCSNKCTEVRYFAEHNNFLYLIVLLKKIYTYYQSFQTFHC